MYLACELRRRCDCGPGYASPQDAFLSGPREQFLFVTCPHTDPSKHDIIVSVDVDPASETFCQVVSRVDLPNANDEVHHTGWNACSSCYGDSKAKRCFLVAPCLLSSRIYLIDTSLPKALKIHKVVEPEALLRHDVSFPHTTHCLADGNIMISTLADAHDGPRGEFLLLDGKSFETVGTWIADGSERPRFNYDFWYQPRNNVMISTEWGATSAIKQGFQIADVQQGVYGSKIHVWDWKEHKLEQSIDLGAEGAVPLEVRFLHDPASTHGFVGTALGSSVYHIYKKQGEDGGYVAESVISIAPKEVTNWMLSEMPALITDILISMDDKYLYLACWLHGDIQQYDITDPFKPKFVARVCIGGCLHEESTVVPKNDQDRVETRYVKGQRIEGGPQMLQLSLDGTRLYVTTSLFRAWDQQFYPNMKRSGSRMLQIDVNTDKGGLDVNENFLINFGSLDGGPFYAHEMRYPGGDCTSDIWI